MMGVPGSNPVGGGLKFNENPSRGKGDVERTGNQRLKLVTFNCDLDLVWVWLS